MEANFLRLILILAGVALVLGIYLWERYKKDNAKVHAVRRDIELELEESPKDRVAEKVMPPSADSESVVIEQELDKLDSIVRDEGVAEAEDEGEQIPFFFASDEAEQKAQQAAEKLPQKILVINIVSRKGPFPGDDILHATQEVGLEAGAMDIFHRIDSSTGGKSLFSMASMVEPGSFPCTDMSAFSTPGLLLFTQLPGPKDGMAIFDDMLSTAERLAERLDGELQDETHSVLTRQAIDHTREEVVEFQRRLRIARKTS